MKGVGEVEAGGRGGVKLTLTTIPVPPPEKTTLKKPNLIRVNYLNGFSQNGVF